MASVILTGVVTFFGLVWTWDSGSFAPLFLLIAVPALGAFSAMAPVPHSHNTAGAIALIVIPTLAVLVIWFTWVMSRRMLDVLWPLPGMPQRDSESTDLHMKL
jgi:hypothetical protein